MPIRETCEAIEPLLAPYDEPGAADALSAAERGRVSEHLAGCEPCRRKAAACRSARMALRANAAKLMSLAPLPLSARCRRIAAREAAPRRAVRWVGWSAAGAAAAIFLFIFVMPAQAVATQLAIDHVSCTKFGARPAATATAAELEQGWYARRNQRIRIPAGSDALGLRLLGIRRCLSTKGAMAHVMYDSFGTPVSLFILADGARLESDDAAGSGGTELETIGHTALLWTSGPQTYALVARGKDLSSTAAYMQKEIGSSQPR